MTSQSSVGSTRITLQFGLNRDIDGAARDVQAAINAARADLPTSLRSNPTYRKVNPADAPILILALTSDTLTAASSTTPPDRAGSRSCRRSTASARSSSAAVRCRRCASSSIRRRCSNTASAWRTCAPRWPAPTPTARRAASTSAPALPDLHQRPGQQGRRLRRWSSPTATARRCGCPTCRRGHSIRSRICATLGLANGKPAVLVILYRQPGANIIDTVDRVKALMPQLKASLPRDRPQRRVDRSTTIRASLRDVERTLIIAVLLVILVVFAVPAQPARDADPERRGAGLADRHVRRDVSAGLQPRQSLADGADGRDRLRGRRRHRGAGEHHPPYRTGMPRRLHEAALRGAREVGFTVLSMSICR
jgi:multidrug efflux pump